MRQLVGVVGTAVAMLVVGTAQAQAPGAQPPVVFVDTDPVVTSCKELAGAGLRVGIRNETGIRQRVRSSVELVRKNGRTVEPRAVCGGLTMTPKQRVLGPGARATVTLTAPNAVRKGSFSGTLAVYARRGRVARTDLTISSDPPPTPGLAATPWVESVKTDLDLDERGPIWVPVKGPAADLPPAKEGKEEEEAVTVGALAGPGDPVAVVLGESRSLGDGASRLGLELEGDLAPGTYSGQVDLAPQDDEKGTLTLEVRVSKEAWLAAAAILVGTLLGALLLWIVGRLVPRARLLGRVDGLSRRYRAAVNALARADGGTKVWNRFRIENLDELQKGLREKIKEATGGWKVLTRIEESAMDDLETAIAGVEAQVDLLKEVPTHGRGLEAALQLPRPTQLPPLRQPDGAQRKPLLDVEAEETLAGESIPAEDLESRFKRMDDLAKRVERLRDLEERLRERWLELEELKDTGHPSLARAENQLRDCREKLWKEKKEERLEEVEEKLKAVKEDLEEVPTGAEASPPRGKFRTYIWGGSSQAEDTQMLAQPLAVQADPAELGGRPQVQPSGAAAEEPLSSRLEEEEADKAVEGALKLSLVVVLVSLGLAVASGLGALYVGKTWGTNWDIVAAIVWGAAAQAVVSTLATAVDDLGALASLRRGNAQ
jgi:hypothetical protein